MDRGEVWNQYSALRQTVEAHYFLWGDDNELAQLEILLQELEDFEGMLLERRGELTLPPAIAAVPR